MSYPPIRTVLPTVSRRGLLVAAAVLLLAGPSPAQDDRFRLHGESRTVPFKLNSNKVYLAATVNGTGPWPFVLDTGAHHTSIDLDLARNLKLAVAPRAGVRGAGERRLEAGEVTVDELALPGLAYRPGRLAAFPLNRAVSAVEGRPLRGLLGADVFDRFVVEIDYAKKQATFHDPDRFRYAGPGASIPLTRRGGHAFVRGEVETAAGERLAGTFLVDTGARLALTLNTPFVNEHRLLAGDPKPVLATVGGGIGGAVVHHVGRVRSLRLGRLTVARPVTTFSQDRTGVFAAADRQGLIGAEILRRYRVIVDYPRGQFVLEATAAAAEPYEFDMSGLFLAAGPPDFKAVTVQCVTAGSPAAASVSTRVTTHAEPRRPSRTVFAPRPSKYPTSCSACPSRRPAAARSGRRTTASPGPRERLLVRWSLGQEPERNTTGRTRRRTCRWRSWRRCGPTAGRSTRTSRRPRGNEGWTSTRRGAGWDGTTTRRCRCWRSSRASSRFPGLSRRTTPAG